MKNPLVDKVYEFVNHIIHGPGKSLLSERNFSSYKHCPITGLDISMQPGNSKFLSYTGVKWYFEHNRKIYNTVLAPRLSIYFKNADPDIQFRVIAHSIRNSDSNPRNNYRRAIQKVLSEKECLFNNLNLIDKEKLKEAGLSETLNK